MSSPPPRRSAIAADATTSLGPPLDADRVLALTYVPVPRRRAIAALWHLDAALGAVLAGGRETLISQIKLVWWRDRLAALDRERAPAEPLLQELAAHVLPAGVSGEQLSSTQEGWDVLLSPAPLDAGELDVYARGRGARLFVHSATLLGQNLPPEFEAAGEAWALADLARHSNAEDAAAALDIAATRIGSFGRPPWPPRIRPLGMLAALAARDIARGYAPMEPHGAPPRMLRMLRHRIHGR